MKSTSIDGKMFVLNIEEVAQLYIAVIKIVAFRERPLRKV